VIVESKAYWCKRLHSLASTLSISYTIYTTHFAFANPSQSGCHGLPSRSSLSEQTQHSPAIVIYKPHTQSNPNDSRHDGRRRLHVYAKQQLYRAGIVITNVEAQIPATAIAQPHDGAKTPVSDADAPPCHITKLPPGLRLMVYELVFQDSLRDISTLRLPKHLGVRFEKDLDEGTASTTAMQDSVEKSLVLAHVNRAFRWAYLKLAGALKDSVTEEYKEKKIAWVLRRCVNGKELTCADLSEIEARFDAVSELHDLLTSLRTDCSDPVAGRETHRA
jgi:hypothetical protein